MQNHFSNMVVKSKLIKVLNLAVEGPYRRGNKLRRFKGFENAPFAAILKASALHSYCAAIVRGYPGPMGTPSEYSLALAGICNPDALA
ncbi:hypothetical protein ACFSJU_17550 [Paradesertivirga mongoliensis]|uniref:Uncharacterized protein n=1 Tax=Paradesertivirga mongoliensis TaxID=2100740 RepID=A0ABW4ZQU9_9SPHI|nr:hypothetical protein [Pedobacter mongoliensis]